MEQHSLFTISDFLFKLSNKKFVKNLHSFMNGNLNDEIEISKTISSYLTHAFIEAQMSEDMLHVLVVLKVNEFVQLLHSLIHFDKTISEIRRDTNILVFGEHLYVSSM